MSSFNRDRAMNDKVRYIFGSGKDADIHYDGTDLRVKPDSVGSGSLVIDSNDKWLKMRNQADTADLELLKIDTMNEPTFLTRPKHLRFEFDRAPRPVIVKTNGLGASTGTAGDENMLMWPGLTLEQHILGTQTILFPVMTTVGLDIGSMDQTADDGMELCPGIISKHDQRFVVGTDKAFYAEAKIKVADVSGTDDLAFGFRKFEAYQANIDDYDEMACLNVISGDIKIETILNGDDTTTTDTTDNLADAGTVSLKVLVSAAGVVTYQIDDDAPTTTAAFTFDDAEVVVPFLFFLQNTDIAGTVELIHWECGSQ
jgi:hypothetical protein